MAVWRENPLRGSLYRRGAHASIGHGAGTPFSRIQFTDDGRANYLIRGEAMTSRTEAQWWPRLALPALVALLAMPAFAQGTKQTTSRPTHIPTVQQPNSPFGTGWAKPGGTTGSYIYNDLRLADPYSGSMNRDNIQCSGTMPNGPKMGPCTNR
jgi:hypothetical protein